MQTQLGYASFNYYYPLSNDWHQGRSGFEERVRRGYDFRLEKLFYQGRIDVDLNLGAWRRNQPSKWVYTYGIDLGYKVTNYLSLTLGYEDFSGRPLSGLPASQRWQLGLKLDIMKLYAPKSAQNSGNQSPLELWRTVTREKRILYQERVAGTIISFATSNYNVLGSGRDTMVELIIKASTPLSKDVALSYSTRDGTATAGSDYEAKNGSLTIKAGDSSATIPVKIIANTVGEAAEQFSVDLSLSTATAGVRVNPATLTITIDAALAPRVVSIERLTPASSNGTTNSNTVSWLITFSKSVQNIDESDFDLNAGGSSTAATTSSALLQSNGTAGQNVGVSNFALNADDSSNGAEILNMTPRNNDTEALVTARSSNDGPLSLSFHSLHDIADEHDKRLLNTIPTSGINENTFIIDSTADLSAPTVVSIERATLTNGLPNELTNADSVSWRITFSEAVENADASDFRLSGTTAPLGSVVNGSVLELTASGGDLADLNAKITLGFISIPTIQDAVGNALTNTTPSDANDNSYTLENTSPTIVISGVASEVGPAQFTATITFSEAVSGFALNDITPSNATLANFNGSDTVYTVDVTPTATGALSLSIADGAAQDSAGNPSLATTATSSVDLTAPTVVSVVRSSPTDERTNTDSVSWRITFSEAVENADATDFSLSGTTAPLTHRVVSDTELEVTASGGDLANLNAEITLSFAAGHDIQDAVGNALANTTPTGSNDNTFTLANTSPTIVISGVASEVGPAQFTATITFSEAVSGFALNDITPSNATLANFNGSDTVYTVDVTPTATGALSLSIADGAAEDSAGNPSLATTATSSVDLTAPTVVSVVRSSPTDERTNTDSVSWRITFSEAVENADASDFSLSGTTASLTHRVESDTELEITASGGDLADLNAEITLSFITNPTIQDAAGNALTNTTPSANGPTANDNSYILDNTAPTVVSIERQNPTNERTNVDSVTWRITFSEAVSNADASDFSLSGTTASLTHRVESDTELDITTASDGNLADLNAEITLSFITNPTIQDAVGNALANTTPTRSNENTFTLDNIAPTVMIEDVPEYINIGPLDPPADFTATIRFSEAVSGFKRGDITVSNANLGAFNGFGRTYTVVVSPARLGIVTLQVVADAGVVKDAAGNGNSASAVVMSTVDTRPVITLKGERFVAHEAGDPYIEASATASDGIDGDITANIVIGGDVVDTQKAGTYILTYNVSDSAGNAADEVTRTVNVSLPDETKPVITLNGPATISLEASSSYTDAGARASDNVDGDISGNIVIDSTKVDSDTVGSYSVTYNVRDAADNAADEVTRTVKVTPDVTKPVITLRGRASDTLLKRSYYVEAGATAHDNVDGDISHRIVKGPTPTIALDILHLHLHL